MIDEEELEVRQMFLEEAQEYVDTMDDGLVGIEPQSSTFRQQMDMILRAAHSLKGAAGIMQFHELSQTAHRLEDSLKIIKTNQPKIDITAERLLLNGVGLLREIILIYRRGQNIDKAWLESHNHKIFEPLEAYLNIAEINAVEDVPEVEIDIAALMFEQEIDEMLADFETKLDSPDLAVELQNLALELTDLGEMLELSNFVQLNRAIAQKTKNSSSDQVPELAVSALSLWRRSQVLVIAGKKTEIPAEFGLALDDNFYLPSLSSKQFNLEEEFSEFTFLNRDEEVKKLELDDLLTLDINDSRELVILEEEIIDDISLISEDYEQSILLDQEIEFQLDDITLSFEEAEEFTYRAEEEELTFLDRDQEVKEIELDDLLTLDINDSQESVILEEEIKFQLDDLDDVALSFEEAEEYASAVGKDDIDKFFDLFDLSDNRAAIEQAIFQLVPELAVEQLFLTENISSDFNEIVLDDIIVGDIDDFEGLDNPFSQTEESENISDSFNPFEDSLDDEDLINDFENIFELNTNDEPLVELELLHEPELLVELELIDRVFDKVDTYIEPNLVNSFEAFMGNSEEIENIELVRQQESLMSPDDLGLNDISGSKTPDLTALDLDLFFEFSDNNESDLNLAIAKDIVIRNTEDTASNRQQESFSSINNISLNDVSDPKTSELDTQNLDLFFEFSDNNESDLNLAISKDIAIPNTEDAVRKLAQIPKQTDIISDLFNDFFNTPTSTPVKPISPNLSPAKVNDLFDSFLEDSDFIQPPAQDFTKWLESDTNDGFDSVVNTQLEDTLENSEQDLFSSFSNETLGKNLSRYVKESTESQVRESLPDTLEDLQEDLEYGEDLPNSITSEVYDLVNTYVKDTSIRLPISRLEQLHDLSEEMVVGHNSLDGQIKQLRQLLKSLHDRIRPLEDANSQLSVVYDRMTTESIAKTYNSKSEVINSAEFDSLEFDSYSELHSLSQSVSEAIVQLQEVVEDVGLSLNETEQNATSLTSNFRQLQASIKETKMRPLMDVVGKFRRAIRSLNLEHDKEVELVLNGADLMVEQTILDAINDPLNHLLRNAFDHGIEDKNTRIQRGKNPKSRIEITAARKDRKILITVADDGGGIDPQKIKAKAERSPSVFGIIIDKIATMDSEQLIQLIFEPGFTTNDQVTSLSGRGVGMDVVRTNLKQIDAEIHTQTQLGIGTTFTIAIPFTLTALRIALIEVNQMILGIPTDSILGVIPDVRSGYEDSRQWQDQIIRIFPLHEQIQRPLSDRHLEDKPSSATKSIVIISQGQNIWGIYVNGCWGEQEVTLRQPAGKIPLPKIFAGCAIAANGQSIPILNMQILNLQIQEQNSVKSPPEGKITPTLNQPNSILVVDDSINVRRYLALILKKAGFKVEQAKDGEEAIAKLQEGSLVDVVLSDVEMPRLDGYGLLSQIKSDPKLQYLPVVMLTSRSGDKHRDLAIALGAAEYFTKPFAEEELIQCLKNLALTSVPNIL